MEQPTTNPFHPDLAGRTAVVVGGESLTFSELDRRTRALADVLDEVGLGFDDPIAIIMRNGIAMIEALWAAHRLGTAYTPVNWHLLPSETAYVIGDSGARVLLGDLDLAASVDALTPGVEHRLVVGDGNVEGIAATLLNDGAATLAGRPTERDDLEGLACLYSSGTTGRPKAIVMEHSEYPLGEHAPLVPILTGPFGMSADSTILICGPLYHAMPLAFMMGSHRLGATVVVMPRFEAAEMLQLIERHQATHLVAVPTMLSRALKLPENARRSVDVSSLVGVVHAGAPCSPHLKRAIIDWWGPVVHEFYAATEGIGMTWIGSEEWLEHPGSVGKAMVGEPHIVGDDGDELPSGEVGRVFFGGGWEFRYRGDADDDRTARSPQGWSTVGDLGYLDDDGYLYLSGRRTDLVLSGGVNVYPIEVEHALLAHPDVLDATAFGIPDDDLGERVHAVVSLVDTAGGEGIEERLIEHCRVWIAAYKCPRSIEVVKDLPRQPNGKVRVHELAERYWLTPD